MSVPSPQLELHLLISKSFKENHSILNHFTIHKSSKSIWEQCTLKKLHISYEY